MTNYKDEISSKELAYFMGKVDNQLTQILEILQEQKHNQEAVSRATTKQNLEIQYLKQRVTNLELWKNDYPERKDVISFQWLREKFSVPIIVAVVIFLLTTVIPTAIMVYSIIKGKGL